MANNFDNIESTGFSFGEEEEGALEALVQEASGASEPSDGEEALDHEELLAPVRPSEPSQPLHQEEVPQLSIQEEPVQEVAPVTPPQEQQPVNLTKETVPQEEEVAPPSHQQEQPQVQEEQHQQATVFPRPRLGQRILDAKAIATTIRIVDVYRTLDQTEQDVAVQLILPENEADTVSIEQLVMGVFSVDPMLPRITKALKEAKDLEPMERAFYVMELDDKLLEALGGVVGAFTEEMLPSLREVKKTNYCRELVKAIELIEPPALRTIDATERLLSALGED